MLLVLGLASAAAAQVRTAYPDKRGLKLTDFPRVVKLADNVYGYEDIRNPGFTTVSLIVVGSDGVLIADGRGSPAATQKLLDAIAKITPKPVKWYIVGSDHGDHTAGNSVLPKDITYVISKNSKAKMDRDAATPSRHPNAPAVVVPPAAMTGDKEVLNLGGIEVQAHFLGRAHTGGDLIVYLPEAEDPVHERGLPQSRLSRDAVGVSHGVGERDRQGPEDGCRSIRPRAWLHRRGEGIREELIEFQKALKAVIAEVNRLHKLGLSADDAVKQANWGPYTDWFLRDQQAPIAVRKVYEEIEGKLK